MDDREEAIRTRAYELWEQAGSPTGEADHFWHRAAQEVDSADRSVAASSDLVANGRDQTPIVKSVERGNAREDAERATHSGREGGSR